MLTGQMLPLQRRTPEVAPSLGPSLHSSRRTQERGVSQSATRGLRHRASRGQRRAGRRSVLTSASYSGGNGFGAVGETLPSACVLQQELTVCYLSWTAGVSQASRESIYLLAAPWCRAAAFVA